MSISLIGNFLADGPDNISLSHSVSYFYIEEHAKFTIECFASCHPNCKYLWKGHDTTESKTLVITSFEKEDAGNYTCYVTNQETNDTLNSKSIILDVKAYVDI
ncbi:hypothetical protein CHS0354_038647 [Potamilus streckersoni]|uniref:Ig-like domain-containing protein n=1 Tax=Potamilus streckersoni TaxID=2493646 RepID=A0AAE0T7E1_9BIVA|nr:hypothetical protein CHS0354_038647 [Potamilus streckersoni]